MGCIQDDMLIDGPDHLVKHIPELFVGSLTQDQGEIQIAQPEEERAGKQQGEGTFDHLGSEDPIAAVGRHEEHVALFGVHVPMQRYDAQDSH